MKRVECFTIAGVLSAINLGFQMFLLPTGSYRSCGYDTNVGPNVTNVGPNITKVGPNVPMIPTPNSTKVLGGANRTKPSLVVVTGASANHFKILQNDLLATLREHILADADFPFDVRVIFYDLDYKPWLQREHEETLADKYSYVEYRKFDYASYPPYFDINQNRGEYAWKPVIIEEVVLEQRKAASHLKSLVYWLDAGIKILSNNRCKKLTKDLEYATKNGIYTFASSGFLKKWTRNGTADFLGLDEKIYNSISTRIGSGSVVLIDANNDRIVNEIIQPWSKCAQARECIAPPGSSRKNHRQDQSALSVLLNKHKIAIPSGTGCVERGSG